MGWTAPRTFVVGEIETAAIFNTHLRDNLLYLKGQAGAILFEDAAMFQGVVSAAGAGIVGTGGALVNVVGTATSTTIGVTSPNIAGMNAVLSLTNTGQRNAQIYMDRANDKLKISQNGTANPGITIDSGGSVGIQAATTPQGPLHAYGSISGFMHYEFDGVAGVAQTILPNAAGDVVYGVLPIWAVRASDGNTQGGSYSTGGTALLAPGGVLSIYSAAGPNTLQLQVNANGAVTVIRTAGALTYKVALLLLWL